ncbi:hypothetical protein CEXT_360441 [Caerostris extrusa]|uniref:Uncharacterized protein n=1 Tax=Caerostris extrusa TaxID=172846 RepID=A0AAV4XZL3_CAEEX|nr:hypothetical protein CEXT_360441 [Caerostris extrusa]
MEKPYRHQLPLLHDVSWHSMEERGIAHKMFGETVTKFLCRLRRTLPQTDKRFHVSVPNKVPSSLFIVLPIGCHVSSTHRVLTYVMILLPNSMLDAKTIPTYSKWILQHDRKGAAGAIPSMDPMLSITDEDHKLLGSALYTCTDGSWVPEGVIVDGDYEFPICGT